MPTAATRAGIQGQTLEATHLPIQATLSTVVCRHPPRLVGCGRVSSFQHPPSGPPMEKALSVPRHNSNPNPKAKVSAGGTGHL